MKEIDKETDSSLEMIQEVVWNNTLKIEWTVNGNNHHPGIHDSNVFGVFASRHYRAQCLASDAYGLSPKKIGKSLTSLGFPSNFLFG